MFYSDVTIGCHLRYYFIISLFPGKVSVVFIAYNNLAQWMSPGDTDPSTGQSESGLGERITDTEVRTSNGKGNTTHKWAVNTKIISTSLNQRAASVPLTKPVTFVLQHTNVSHLSNVAID